MDKFNYVTTFPDDKPFKVVERRQYCNGSWDKHYCLRVYNRPDYPKGTSEYIQEFDNRLVAAQFAVMHGITIRDLSNEIYNKVKNLKDFQK